MLATAAPAVIHGYISPATPFVDEIKGYGDISLLGTSISYVLCRLVNCLTAMFTHRSRPAISASDYIHAHTPSYDAQLPKVLYIDASTSAFHS
jgi:hypothetical protein